MKTSATLVSGDEKWALRSAGWASWGTLAMKALKGGRSGRGMPEWEWEVEEGWGGGLDEEAESVVAVVGLAPAAGGAAAASDGVEMMGTSTDSFFWVF